MTPFHIYSDSRAQFRIVMILCHNKWCKYAFKHVCSARKLTMSPIVSLKDHLSLIFSWRLVHFQLPSQEPRTDKQTDNHLSYSFLLKWFVRGSSCISFHFLEQSEQLGNLLQKITNRSSSKIFKILSLSRNNYWCVILVKRVSHNSCLILYCKDALL